MYKHHYEVFEDRRKKHMPSLLFPVAPDGIVTIFERNAVYETMITIAIVVEKDYRSRCCVVLPDVRLLVRHGERTDFLISGNFFKSATQESKIRLGEGKKIKGYQETCSCFINLLTSAGYCGENLEPDICDFTRVYSS